jgi:hypothetical protein
MLRVVAAQLTQHVESLDEKIETVGKNVAYATFLTHRARRIELSQTFIAIVQYSKFPGC